MREEYRNLDISKLVLLASAAIPLFLGVNNRGYSSQSFSTTQTTSVAEEEKDLLVKAENYFRSFITEPLHNKRGNVYSDANLLVGAETGIPSAGKGRFLDRTVKDVIIAGYFDEEKPQSRQVYRCQIIFVSNPNSFHEDPELPRSHSFYLGFHDKTLRFNLERDKWIVREYKTLKLHEKDPEKIREAKTQEILLLFRIAKSLQNTYSHTAKHN